MIHESVDVESKENDDDAGTDDIESCLRPRENRAVSAKLRPPFTSSAGGIHLFTGSAAAGKLIAGIASKRQ
eukprot:scaffold8686_cov122-Skeletonema_menzelii.AAC.9